MILLVLFLHYAFHFLLSLSRAISSFSVSLLVFFCFHLATRVIRSISCFHSPFLFCLNSSLIFLRATSCLRWKKAALVKHVILLYPAFLYPTLFYSFRAPLSFSFSQLFFAPDRVSLFFVFSLFRTSFPSSFYSVIHMPYSFFHPLHSRLSLISVYLLQYNYSMFTIFCISILF